MPNQRARTQRLVNFPASDQFIAGLDEAIRKVGYSNRSEFIRDAVEEKLRELGFQLPPGATLAPPRAGKGRKSEDPQTAIGSAGGAGPAVGNKDVVRAAKRLLKRKSGGTKDGRKDGRSAPE